MMKSKRFTKPEIMSPAGYWPQLRAAIEAGADAVYFGLNHFTARAKVGFTATELPEVMRTLHQRGIKGYVTFNTLVFDHELREAARSLAVIAEAGADSIIVQDIGVVQLAKQIAPELAVHGSTQMSITSAEGVALAQRVGASRVVLARELSLAEIRMIRAQTDCELEMFVHGALCVSYSGQCFSSEAWGGRSANRGQCAQACRLPYTLIVDEVVRPLGDARYLLSPGDLYALQQMPEIVQLGVSALKIEGRYKDANYVALTTAAYRKAVDEAWADLPLSITGVEELQLAQAYSRGLGPYFVAGTNHQTVVQGRSPRHRGVLMGQVAQLLGDQILITPNETDKLAPLKAGDGIVFDAAGWRSPEEAEEGGHIYHVKPRRDGQLVLEFGNGALNFTRIRPGDLIWRTHDAELDRAARPYTQATTPVHKQPLQLQVTAHEGSPLLLHWRVVEQPHISVTVQSEETLGPAQKRAMTVEYLHEQLGRLGNTAYTLADLQLDMQGNPFAPSSLLNHLRRQAIEQLATQQGEAPAITRHDPVAIVEAAVEAATHPVASLPGQPQLHLLVRTPEQLAAALALKPASITLDYLELYGLRPAVEAVQACGITARVASPRVLKPDEQRIVNFLLRLNCQIVVRATGLLYALQTEAQNLEAQTSDAATTRPPLIGDFSLNAANVLAAQTFLDMGLLRLTPTHDLNAMQVAELARTIGPAQIEAIVYQHLPVFHTEHCVFCRFLSTGTSYKDCGHPCEKHRIALRDHNGRAHPVMADVGCRNTVFGGEAQEASRHLALWQAAGIRHFRLEFVHESGDQVTRITHAFTESLAGKRSARELMHRLQEITPQGSTEGSLFVADNYLEIPLLQ